MTCHYRNNDSSTLLSCMGLTPLFDDITVANFASRVGADNPRYVYYYCISCLRVNRLIRPDIPEGPCGKFGVSPPTGPQVAFGAVSQLAARDPEPISHGILSFIGTIGSFFSGLFSGAPSLKELQTQCSVCLGYNAFADAVEKAIATGQIGIQDAIDALRRTQQTFHGQLDAVMGGSDSAPYSIEHALDALVLFNTEVYYNTIQVSGGLSSLTTGNAPLLIGGGVVAAKVLGVF